MTRKYPKYEECLAFEFINEYFLDIFKKKFKLSDKPDIISTDETVGIEVTSALPEGEYLVESYFENLKEGKPQNFEKMFSDHKGYSINKYFLSHPTMDLSDNKTFYNLICDSIRKKISKSKEYKKTEMLGIYIRCHFIVSKNDETVLKKVCTTLLQSFDNFSFFILEIENENLVVYADKNKTIFKNYKNEGNNITKKTYKLYEYKKAKGV